MGRGPEGPWGRQELKRLSAIIQWKKEQSFREKEILIALRHMKRRPDSTRQGKTNGKRHGLALSVDHMGRGKTHVDVSCEREAVRGTGFPPTLQVGLSPGKVSQEGNLAVKCKLNTHERSDPEIPVLGFIICCTRTRSK